MEVGGVLASLTTMVKECWGSSFFIISPSGRDSHSPPIPPWYFQILCPSETSSWASRAMASPWLAWRTNSQRGPFYIYIYIYITLCWTSESVRELGPTQRWRGRCGYEGNSTSMTLSIYSHIHIYIAIYIYIYRNACVYKCIEDGYVNPCIYKNASSKLFINYIYIQCISKTLRNYINCFLCETLPMVKIFKV